MYMHACVHRNYFVICLIIFFSSSVPVSKSTIGKYFANGFEFDKTTGKFILTFHMSPEEYSHCIKQQHLGEITNLDFNKETGKFDLIVQMTPEEYSQYVQEGLLGNLR